MLWELDVCSFLLDPTLNTSPKPRLQKVLPSRHLCHTRALGFGTLCDMVSPNFHDLNGWDYKDCPQVTSDLGPQCELASSHMAQNVSKSQQAWVIHNHATKRGCKRTQDEVQDDPKLLDDGGEKVGGLDPGYKISSRSPLLDRKLVRWSTASCDLTLACWPSRKKGNKERTKSTRWKLGIRGIWEVPNITII